MTIFLTIFLWMANFAPISADENVQWLTETEFDFGDIKMKEPVSYTFTFKNKSETPLVIETVRTSCGCTGSTWTETPISPDSIGSIVLEFDAKQAGAFNKSAKIYFEGKRSAEKIWVSGFVVEE